VERHNQNAVKIAEHLQAHSEVNWVSYPGLREHPSYHLAQKYFKNGTGSIVVFGIKGGREAGRKVVDNIKLWSHVANVGDAKSLIIHPASTTHQQLNSEELKSTGVTEDLVRLSIGLESPQDLINELDQAIEAALAASPV
jgi:O-acetylhomoserine (thiol)-lyase